MNLNSSLFLQSGKRWGLPPELMLAGEHRLRRGADWRRQLLMLVALMLVAALLAAIVGDLDTWFITRLEILILFAGFGCWRWSWFMLQTVRAAIYRYWTFPRLRREADHAVAKDERGPVPEVTILAVTYRERPWITDASFTSVYREFSSLRGLTRPPRLVVATGCDEDDRAIQRVHNECCDSLRGVAGNQWPPELVLLRDASGKRPAIANALREIIACNPHPEGVVLFLDGDTIMQPGLLQKVLPLFRLKPDVDAVTTDEDAWVQGPRWFAEWISLRLGLRHRTMCSVALSGRLLCLTGRLSAFRARVTLEPTFLGQIENDSIQHWLWGKFDMLSGDDKSTWFWLAARGRRMLYAPDALATTIEVVSGPPVKRALANIRRWSGNSMRHSWRAFQLGPRRLGWFPWYSLLDQRLAIWTVLIGPLFALLALCSGRIEIAAGYALWVLGSRLMHSAMSWRHGRRISVYYLPLQIISDWIIAITKVWVLFHPAKQSWLNRGARTLDARRGFAYVLRRGFALYLCGFTCVATVLLIGIYARFIPVLNEVPLFSTPPAEAGLASPGVEPGVRPVMLFGTDAPVGGQNTPGTTTPPSAGVRRAGVAGDDSAVAASATQSGRSARQDGVTLATLPQP